MVVNIRLIRPFKFLFEDFGCVVSCDVAGLDGVDVSRELNIEKRLSFPPCLPVPLDSGESALGGVVGGVEILSKNVENLLSIFPLKVFVLSLPLSSTLTNTEGVSAEINSVKNRLSTFSSTFPFSISVSVSVSILTLENLIKETIPLFHKIFKKERKKESRC